MAFINTPNMPIQFMGFSLEIRKAIYPWPNTRKHVEIDNAVKQLEINKDNKKDIVNNNLSQKHTNFGDRLGQKRIDGIVISNIDAKSYDKGIESIVLPFIPQELSVNPETTYVAIKPIGRNTFDYFFIGSEDLLEFEIDWFSMAGQKDYVINQCRKVEALSKPDGYKRQPPRVKIIWGASDVLFKNRIFQVLKAPYKLSNFKTGYYDSQNNFINTNMLPHQAIQTITLARVADASLTHAMILK